jgi:hypothetical protein
VNVDGVMRTLQQRGLIAEVGRDPGPGQAVLYGTTVLFLEKLGLDSLDQLPSLADFVPGAEVMDVLEQGLRHTDSDRPGSDRPDEPDAGDAVGRDTLGGVEEVTGVEPAGHAVAAADAEPHAPPADGWMPAGEE